MLEQYSVLMSVYYRENPEYLRQSINSILLQTIPTDDFILVCDGPLTPELDKVILEYEKKIRIVRTAKNLGLGNALNYGIGFCKHDLIARMDSDDISDSKRCERQLLLFEKNLHLDIVSGTVEEFVDTVSNIKGKRTLPSDNIDIIKYSKRRCPFNHPCVMFRKSAVEQAGGYSSKYRMEDYYLWIRMLQCKCIAANLNETLLYMRTPVDLYARRGGYAYAKEILKFRWWMYRSGWSKLRDFLIGSIPHILVSLMPNIFRKTIYQKLHR